LAISLTHQFRITRETGTIQSSDLNPTWATAITGGSVGLLLIFKLIWNKIIFEQCAILYILTHTYLCESTPEINIQQQFDGPLNTSKNPF
jgi:hypothetical protein